MSVCVFSILFSNISYHTDMENLFLNLNPGLLFLAINSFILVTVWYRKATLDAANSKGLRVKLPWKHPTGWSARGILIELMQKKKKTTASEQISEKQARFVTMFFHTLRSSSTRAESGFLGWIFETNEVFFPGKMNPFSVLHSFLEERKSCFLTVSGWIGRTVAELYIGQ